MKSPVDWRQHPRQFHCRCDACVATLGPIARRNGYGAKTGGKFWQRGYGESNPDFRRRYLAAHTGRLSVRLVGDSILWPISSL